MRKAKRGYTSYTYFFDLGAIVNVILSCYSCPSSYITWVREFFRLDSLVCGTLSLVIFILKLMKLLCSMDKNWKLNIKGGECDTVS